MVGMTRGADRGEKPAFLSPFMWAAAMAYQVSERREEYFVPWAGLATVLLAWFAFEVLVSTIVKFDERLGRISDGATRLLKSSRRMKILSGIFLALAFLLSVLTDNPELVPVVVALQFVLGTFLAAASAASSSAVGRTDPESGATAFPGISASRLIWLKWLGAMAVFWPSLFLAWVICLIQMIRLPARDQFWSEMPVMIAYMLSAGGVAASLGVAIWVWPPRRGGAVVFAVVAWALVNAGFLTLAAAVPGESLAGGLAMSSPVRGVWTLCGTDHARIEWSVPAYPVGSRVGCCVFARRCQLIEDRAKVASAQSRGLPPGPIACDLTGSSAAKLRRVPWPVVKLLARFTESILP